jgi:hypothetical protein
MEGMEKDNSKLVLCKYGISKEIGGYIWRRSRYR